LGEAANMIKDTEFNLTHSKQYELAVLIESAGFSFTAYHAKEKKILFVDEYHFEESLDADALLNKLEEILKKNEFVYAPFYACKVGISTPVFTVVPQSLFEDGTERKLLSSLCQTSATASVETQLLPSLEMNFLYEIPLQTKLFFKKQFLRLNFSHSFSYLFQNWFSQIKNKTTAQYLLQFEADFFYVALIKEGKLFCINAFKYNTPEDFIYYLLFVLETHKVDNLEVELTLYGNIQEHPKHNELLTTYIKNISYGKRPTNLILSDAFNPLPSNQLGTLLNLASCE